MSQIQTDTLGNWIWEIIEDKTDLLYRQRSPVGAYEIIRTGEHSYSLQRQQYRPQRLRFYIHEVFNVSLQQVVPLLTPYARADYLKRMKE